MTSARRAQTGGWNASRVARVATRACVVFLSNPGGPDPTLTYIPLERWNHQYFPSELLFSYEDQP